MLDLFQENLVGSGISIGEFASAFHSVAVLFSRGVVV